MFTTNKKHTFYHVNGVGIQTSKPLIVRSNLWEDHFNLEGSAGLKSKPRCSVGPMSTVVDCGI